VSRPKFGKSFNDERRMFNTKLYKHMKKLSVSQLERVSGGRCDSQIMKEVNLLIKLNEAAQAGDDDKFYALSIELFFAQLDTAKCFDLL
jgi:hypothetical protein